MIERKDITEAEYFAHPYISNSDLSPDFDTDKLANALRLGTGFHETVQQLPLSVELDTEEHWLMRAMKDALYNDRFFKQLLPHLHSPETKWFNHFLMQRAMIDHSYKKSTAIEYKSTSCATECEFRKTINEYDYDRAGYHYLGTSGYSELLILGVSKVSFQVFPYLIRRGDAMYNSGRIKHEAAINTRRG